MLEPITTSIWLDTRRPRLKKTFRCTQCGNIVFQYYDAVNIIIPGEPADTPDSAPILTIQCRERYKEFNPLLGIEEYVRCKARYTIYR